MRNAHLLLFFAPGDRNRGTGPYCTHASKIQNLRAFGNVRQKSPLLGLAATCCSHGKPAAACGRRGAWRLYCFLVGGGLYARRSLVKSRRSRCLRLLRAVVSSTGG